MSDPQNPPTPLSDSYAPETFPLRAEDEATMRAAFVEFGLLLPDFDDDGQPIHVKAKGLTIAWGLPAYKQKTVIDEDTGEVITPGVMDTRFHVDLMVQPPVGHATLDQIKGMWEAFGVPGVPNKEEQSLVLNGVELITGIHTKDHVVL